MYFSGEIVKNKFKNLKDTFRRLKNESKAKSGSGLEKSPLEKWEYASHLSFLTPYIQEARCVYHVNII